jgi:hypothetical protein
LAAAPRARASAGESPLVEFGQRFGFERFVSGGHFGNQALLDSVNALLDGVDALVQMTLHSREKCLELFVAHESSI